MADGRRGGAAAPRRRSGAALRTLRPGLRPYGAFGPVLAARAMPGRAGAGGGLAATMPAEAGRIGAPPRPVMVLDPPQDGGFVATSWRWRWRAALAPPPGLAAAAAGRPRSRRPHAAFRARKGPPLRAC